MPEPTEQLKRFLRDNISSYEELEILLLLSRQPGVNRSDQDLAMSLGAPLERVTTALEALRATDCLLHTEERGDLTYFSYAPASDEVGGLVSELGSVYAERPLAVIQIMSANAFERVRGATARRLADAFRLERPKK